MTELQITLKRITEKGFLKFEVPEAPEMQEALKAILRLCHDRYNDYEVVKYCIKMIAVEQLGYPYVVPKRKSFCDSYECALLIEASHILAAQMEVTLKETNK